MQADPLDTPLTPSPADIDCSTSQESVHTQAECTGHDLPGEIENE